MRYAVCFNGYSTSKVQRRTSANTIQGATHISKTYLKLQQSEGFVIEAAAQIYAAYITSGRLNEENKESLMKEAIRDALRIALTVDETIIAENEPG